MVFICDPGTKRFLLVKHKKLGKWTQSGGHIEPNEDPEESAIREAFEETGLKVKLIGQRFIRDNDYIKPLALQKNLFKGDPEHIHIDFVYVAVPDGISQSVKVNYNEAYDLNWFSLSEIRDPNFSTFDDVRDWCEFIHNNILSAKD
jgi:8-oxo-dGTP pyrophosphatase MutT (NUDIX family)